LGSFFNIALFKACLVEINRRALIIQLRRFLLLHYNIS